MRAPARLEQDSACQPEKGKETNDIRHSRHKSPRGKGRINPDFFKDNRHHRSSEPRDDQIDDHCDCDDTTKLGRAKPDDADDAHDDRKSETIQKPHQHLTADDPPDVRACQVARGKSAHGHGQ